MKRLMAVTAVVAILGMGSAAGAVEKRSPAPGFEELSKRRTDPKPGRGCVPIPPKPRPKPRPKPQPKPRPKPPKPGPIGPCGPERPTI